MNILITGGAGFIGSAMVRYLINYTEHSVINVDKLTYAGSLRSLESVENSERYHFEQADICASGQISGIFCKYQPDAVINLAAESHVDRSIQRPDHFIQSNILGTYCLLEASREYWHNLSDERKVRFRFLQVSTDEVYGDLADVESVSFNENAAYKPSSPYSASKAAGDHLVQAWHRTYGLPTLITHSTNNYGPFQFPEKLIPRMILNALKGELLPIYGNGQQMRDWIFVEDHIKALYQVLQKGRVGQSYHIGANTQLTNLELVQKICDVLEQLSPNKPQNITSYRDLITFVEDRAGHDLCYGLDTKKIQQELGWQAEVNFDSGLRKTVEWYLQHQDFWENVKKLV